jgi:hypothetical protein
MTGKGTRKPIGRPWREPQLAGREVTCGPSQRDAECHEYATEDQVEVAHRLQPGPLPKLSNVERPVTEKRRGARSDLPRLLALNRKTRFGLGPWFATAAKPKDGQVTRQGVTPSRRQQQDRPQQQLQPP